MKVEPEILPPAFYPVGLNLTGRRCIVIGDDDEARAKAADLRETGADVVTVRDAGGLREEDVATGFLVVSTPQDAALSARLREWADRHRFLLCAIDQPAYGFVAMQATVKAGPARIAISTGGVSPRVAAVLRERLQSALDAKFVRFLGRLAERRRLNRVRHAGDANARREAMRRAADGFDLHVSVTFPDWFEEERD